MLVKSSPLSNAQVDGLEQLAKHDMERVLNGWVLLARPVFPPIREGTIRALIERGLCRSLSSHGREVARITQAGRRAISEIQAVRARIHSAA